MSDRHLVLLASYLPHISRMTRWRIEKEPGFPAPIIVRKRKYYDSDELAAWEESRRVTPKRRTAEAAPNAPPDNETTPPR